MAEQAGLGARNERGVGERLRLRRRSLGLTQHQVVERLAALGVRTTNKALSNLERGAGLHAAKLPELARALDCSVTYLVGLSDDPRRWRPDATRAAPASPPSPPSADASAERMPWILGPDVPDLRGPTRQGQRA